MSRRYFQLCVPGPDGKQQCHPIGVPTWIVNGGIPPPDNDQSWVDVQTVTVIDAWVGRSTNEAVRTRLASAVDEVMVEPSKMLPEGIELNRAGPR